MTHAIGIHTTKSYQIVNLKLVVYISSATDKAEAMRKRPSYLNNDIGLTVAVDESIVVKANDGENIINTNENFIRNNGKLEAITQYPHPLGEENDVLTMAKSERKLKLTEFKDLKDFNLKSLKSIQLAQTPVDVEIFENLQEASDEDLENGGFNQLIEARTEAVKWSSKFVSTISAYG